MLCHDADNYMTKCNICLALKIIQHKPYNDLQSLPVSTYCWKNLAIHFVIGLSILTDQKRDCYDLILVIINQLTKMVHSKPVKATIHALDFVEIIINIVVRHHGLSDLIITNRGSFFILKF